MPKARQAKITWLPGHYYHIYNRGARRKSIFYEPDNYIFVIKKIKKYAIQFNLSIIAYCLMPNHYHFLVRQNSDQRASLLPERVFLSYTKAFNRRYQESGTLFESRFKAKHIDNEPWLLYLCKYIHFNPVKDRLVSSPDSWIYSNYPDWINQREGTLLDKQFVIDHFHGAKQYQNEMTQFLIDNQFDVE